MTVVWTQWPVLELPADVTHLSTDGSAPMESGGLHFLKSFTSTNYL